MKRLLTLLILTTLPLSCQNDFGNLQILASLPINEVSGIETLPNSDLVWMIADSGNENAVYGYNIKTKDIERVITITNGKNKDWEDLASDEKGNLYIGDFGNNHNKRKDLTIYTLPKVNESNATEMSALKTTFYLEDQDEFPPKKKDFNFDIEAFLFLNDQFYLFSRNRSKDFNGTTKLYKIPAKEGNFEAKLIGTFTSCEDKRNCQITSADIDPKTGTIALLSYSNVWLFDNYNGDNFFGGDVRRFKMEYRSQKESIAFKDRENFYIADELTGLIGGNLYVLPIPPNN